MRCGLNIEKVSELSCCESNNVHWTPDPVEGGTVNISWHPPALMARGMAFEHAAKNFQHLGEAILAGQLYLTANWNNQSDVVDNYEWYSLQGDPSMNIAK